MDERNPFSLTPKVGRASAPPDLAQRAIKTPVVQPGIDGLQIVNALVQFAGIAGSEYTRKIEKSIEADKAVQTSLAMQHMLPTDDATVAGYQAHAAVAIKGQTLGAQHRLDEIARRDITDDEWHEAIKEEYRRQDEYLEENYDEYAKNIDMQKLAAVSLREMIPQVGSTRAAAKIGYEIEKRVNSATDVFVNAAANPLAALADPKDMLSVTDGMLNSLQLTASQKDTALERAIVETRNPTLIKLAESFKGDRSTSLASRSGKIQQVKAQLETQDLANQAIDFEKEVQTLEKGLIGDSVNPPSMTMDEVDSHIKKRNSETDNKFMSRSRYAQLLNDRDRAITSRYDNTEVIKAIQDPNDTNLKDRFKAPQIQAGMKAWVAQREEIGKEKAKELGLTGEEEAKYIRKFRQQTQQYIADKSVKSNEVFDDYVADLKALAGTHIEAVGVFGKTPQGAGIQEFAPQAQRASELLLNMSPSAQRIYLQKLGGDDEEILKRYLNELDLGQGGSTPGPQAMKTAQVQTKNKNPPDFKARASAFKSIRKDTMEPWFGKNLPSNQEAYWYQRTQEKISFEPSPDSPVSRRRITNWLETGVTTTKRGMKLEGSPEQLYEHTGMQVDHLDDAMTAFVESRKNDIASHLNSYGLTSDDVFPVTEPNTGFVELHTLYGPIMGTKTPMRELYPLYKNYNNDAMKRLWENSFKEDWLQQL